MIYLDNGATTKQHPAVISEMLEVIEHNYGNPSSLHTLGVQAERIVKKARQSVAKPLKATAAEVYFTSGGTESNNLALSGAYNALRIKGDIITVKTEHKSVLETVKNLGNVIYLDVDKSGVIDTEALQSLVTENTSLVSISHVNNETGAIAPIEQISDIIKRKNAKCLFHVDAVQSYCKLDFPKNSADLVSVSGHKIHGPKGIGALYVKTGIRLKPLIYGGGQEKGIRSGTENTAAIAGLGVASALKFELEHIKSLNALLRNRLRGVIVNSVEGSPYILNISAPGIRSEILLHSLEQRGVIVSSGSACSSNRPGASHVLTAMGLQRDIIESSIRISLSMLNTEKEIIEATDIINEVIPKLKQQLRKR
ncbi:MAG: cysteine desulfurase [Clostridiaceae bacterium]|nr:cysteine desulfurase [Clostridiaceae bacterium]